MRNRPVALTIAGSDPSGGAGLQADLKTFAALGVYGLSAVALLTAQDSSTVYEAIPVSPAIVAAQIRAATAQARPRAVKTGSLGDASVVEAVAEVVRDEGLDGLVIDPVTRSSSGTRLLSEEGETALRAKLLPLATVVTPNLAEAQALSGIEISGPDAMREAARAIGAIGVPFVVIKGGHLGADQPALDLAFDGTRFEELRAARIKAADPHGTGCAFSAAIAALLARGQTPMAAIRHAKQFVTRAIAHSFVLTGGRPLLDHVKAGSETD